MGRDVPQDDVRREAIQHAGEQAAVAEARARQGRGVDRHIARLQALNESARRRVEDHGRVEIGVLRTRGEVVLAQGEVLLRPRGARDESVSRSPRCIHRCRRIIDRGNLAGRLGGRLGVPGRAGIGRLGGEVRGDDDLVADRDGIQAGGAGDDVEDEIPDDNRVPLRRLELSHPVSLAGWIGGVIEQVLIDLIDELPGIADIGIGEVGILAPRLGLLGECGGDLRQGEGLREKELAIDPIVHTRWIAGAAEVADVQGLNLIDWSCKRHHFSALPHYIDKIISSAPRPTMLPDEIPHGRLQCLVKLFCQRPIPQTVVRGMTPGHRG